MIIRGLETMWELSRHMTLVLSFLVILPLLVTDLPLVFSIRAITQSKRQCSDLSCGNTSIPYPFYTKSIACGRAGFGLECQKTQNSSNLKIEFNKILYSVTKIASDGIIIDPLQSSCSKNLEGFSIKGTPNYAISADNFIQLSGCKNTKDCDLNCNIPLKNSDGQCKFNQTCCFPLLNDTIWHHGESNFSQFSHLRCTSFISWVIGSMVNLDAVYGLKLEWGILGNCSNAGCDPNAQCSKAGDVKGGVRCTCKDGYEGDGFVEGNGCVKVCTRHGQKQYDKDCKHDQNATKIIVISAGLVATATLVAAGIISLAVLCRRRRRQSLGLSGRLRQRRRSDGSQLASLLPARAEELTTELFSYKTLDRATKGFAAAQECGHGACGTVYAGRLPDGRAVAVKRMHYAAGGGVANSDQGAHQLLNEISLLSTIKHKNLVRLLGCCLDADDPILVYEFVPNGTLADHLQRSGSGSGGSALDWRRRCTVAADAARALAHLHADLDPPVYHRDVKSCNILLDHDFNCKVADFGLSRLAPPDGGSHISTAPQGTPGYLDPEYHQNFHLSDKSDVYSFGVVLVEIFTGMKPIDFSRDKKEVNLAALAVAKIAAGRLDDIIDPLLQVGRMPRVSVMVQRMAELAFRCLAYDKDARPAMTEVAEELEAIRRESDAAPAAAVAAEEGEGEELSLPGVAGESPDKVACSPTSVQALWPSNSTTPSDSLTN